MPRPEKVQAVAEIKERVQNAQAVFLAEYAGLSVAQQQTLRRELKANGAEFKVVKMSLARLATAALEIDTLDEHLLGPTGMAIADGDAVAAAKVLKDFARANDVFTVKGGLLGLEYLSPERISELADIEPREVLLAKMAGVFAAPMGNIAGLIAALQRDVVGLVSALVGKREEDGEVAPAAEAADSGDEAEAAADAEEAAPAEEPEAQVEEASTEEEAPAEEAATDDAAPEAEAEEAAPDASADGESAADDDSADDDKGEETESSTEDDEANAEEAEEE